MGKKFPFSTQLTYLLLLMLLGAVGFLLWRFHPSDHFLLGSAREQSAITIVYTMDTNGYLQSCGCTAQQVGGLAKRATLIRSLQEKGKPICLIDGGNLAEDLSRSQIVMDFLKLMRYQAVGVGELDLKLGEDFYRQARQRELPLISCPLPNGSHCGIAPYRLCCVGGKRIAVLKLLKDSSGSILPFLRPALQGIRPQVDLTVVLSPLDFAAEKDLVNVEGFPELIDLVIGMQGSSQRQPVVWGDVTFVPASGKGEVGIIDANFTTSGKPVFAYRMEVVHDALMPDREIQDMVGTYYAQQAQQLLAGSRSFAVDWADLHYQPPGACVECHESQVSLWQTSKHAHARRTLQIKGRLVAECLRCHSELFRRSNKFNSSLTASWNGVECATCHGDGILHSALRDKKSLTRKVTESTCRGCHDHENDPGFEYASYLEKIRHW